jgi:hypothetical protein
MEALLPDVPSQFFSKLPARTLPKAVARRRGLQAVPAFHMVELLDASIRGVTASDLMRAGQDPAA